MTISCHGTTNHTCDRRNAYTELKLDAIDTGIEHLSHTPHIGTLRNEIALGLRAIPIGENAVVAFTVHEDTREVMIYAVTWGGADWMRRSRKRVRG